MIQQSVYMGGSKLHVDMYMLELRCSLTVITAYGSGRTPVVQDDRFEQLLSNNAWKSLQFKRCTQLPDGLANMASLVHVRFDKCTFSSLPSVADLLEALPGIQTLEFWDCNNLTNIDPVAALPALQCLVVRDCVKLDDLFYMQPLVDHTKLCSLSVSDCGGLTKVDRNIGLLIGLTELNLESNGGITTLPSTIPWLSNLQSLSLDLCENLLKLPDHIGDLKSLKRASFRFCSRLQELPVSFQQLHHLTSLDLYGCAELTSLHLSDAVLDAVQDAVAPAELVLQGCDRLPPDVQQLGTNATKCYLPVSHTQQCHTQQCWSLHYCKQPTMLSQWLCGCCIPCIPSCFTGDTRWLLHTVGRPCYPAVIAFLQADVCDEFMKDINWTDLTFFGWTQTALQELFNSTEFTARTCRLQHLALLQCSIKALPFALQYLKTLSTLNISGCGEVQTIDPIKRLQRLEVLKLVGLNSLQELPIARLTNLEVLEVKDCSSWTVLHPHVDQVDSP